MLEASHARAGTVRRSRLRATDISAVARARTVRRCRLLARPLYVRLTPKGGQPGVLRERREAGQAPEPWGCGPPGTSSLAARSLRRGGGRAVQRPGVRPVGSLEVTRHVALVAEAGLGGGSRE
jgi:hypothetical protein